VCVVSDLREGKHRYRVCWRTAVAGCWLLSITAAMGEQGIFVKYKPPLRNVARNYCHELNKTGNVDYLKCKGAMT
ncbi:MAG: hypothetical protein ACKPKO_29720, partial [Candidatus Fonsibacter sp.]